MDDGFMIAIILQPLPESTNGQLRQKAVKQQERLFSPKIKVTRFLKFHLGNQTRVEVSAAKEETIAVEPYHIFYNNHLFLDLTWITDVKSGQPFYIPVANFA